MTGIDRATLADLRAYYEREAELGRRGPVRANRARALTEFVSLLLKEGRRTVLDHGSGPATDAGGFVEAGIAFVGVDLAVGNARLAADRGFAVVAGSMAAPPFRPRSFDAGWSMSTFMHVPEAQAAEVARGMVGPLQVGAPLMVGLWGGPRRDEIDTTELEGEQRLFSLRTTELNGELLSSAGGTEHLETWDVGPDGWEYQLFLVRAGL